MGLRLDCKLNYWAQIQHAAIKAAKRMGMLSRLMANTLAKRKCIMAATNSILLYGSEIWGDAIEIKAKRKILAAVQRTAALELCTVLAAAVLVIVSEIPFI